MSEPPARPGTVRRGVHVALGLACVATGAAGIAVPGLPTTVFLLLGSYLFARSSPRLHRRLHEHPRLGGYLRMAQRRAMPLRAKLIALGAMWLGVGASLLLLSDASGAVRTTMIVMGVAGTAVLVVWVRTLPAESRASIGPR